jgi:hypothetical protein
MRPDQIEYLKTLAPVPPHFQGMGALELHPDPRDWPVTHHPGIAALLPNVPQTASLMQYVTGDPYNQGPTGACVAASTCGACSIDTQHGSSRWDVFHWLALYHEAGGTGSNGVDSRLVLKICAEQGTPLANGGRETVIKSYLWVTQQPGQFRQEVKACIAAGFPPVVALLLPSDWGWRSGQPNAAVTQGYHQVAGIEFDDDYLVILNSWGTWPGGGSPKNGVGSVRWDYLEKDGLQHNYVFAFTTTSDALPPPPPPPPPVHTRATVTGSATGQVDTLMRGTVYSLGSCNVTLSEIDFDLGPPPPPPPPNQLSVTGYSPNPVQAGASFLIQGQGFQGGNLSVLWQERLLSANRLSDTQIHATAPSVPTTASGSVTVRVEGATADGPALTVSAGDEPPPGDLKVTVTARRYSRGLVGIWAYVQAPGSGALDIVMPPNDDIILPPTVLNPEVGGYVAATVQGTVGMMALAARQTTTTGLPAVWQLSQVPAMATITVTAVDDQGRRGQGTASV